MKTRNEKILNLFTEKGLTQTAIALEFGVTKERIRAILLTYLTPAKMREQVKLNLKAKYTKLSNLNKGIEYTCRDCGKPIFDRYTKRDFCNRKCFYRWLKKTSPSLDERKEKRKEQMRAYYHRKKKL